MRIHLTEILIASAAIGALCLLTAAWWWSELNRQADVRARRAQDIETEQAVARQCAEQKAHDR